MRGLLQTRIQARWLCRPGASNDQKQRENRKNAQYILGHDAVALRDLRGSPDLLRIGFRRRQLVLDPFQILRDLKFGEGLEK